MKTIITGVALILIFVQFNIFQLDFDSYLRALDKLKFQAEDCAVVGALCTKDEGYSSGKIIYDIDSSECNIRSMLSKDMLLDDNMNALDNSCWLGQVHYNVFYYDDSGYCVHMRDGAQISRLSFSYGDIYHDDFTGYEDLVVAPSVIVVLEVDAIRHRTMWGEWSKLVRMSSYEYSS